MSSNILSGKDIAESIKSEVSAEIARIKAEHGFTPCLAVVRVGDDPASAVYVGNKVKTSEAIGLISEQHHLPANVSRPELVGLVRSLNWREEVDGILVQLPLPDQINEREILEMIDPEKDVTMLSNAQEIHNILEGKVDAVAGNGNVVVQAKEKGLNDLADLTPKKVDMPGSSVNAEKKWLANNKEAARRFVKATVEAIALTMQDKEKAFASFRKWYGMSDPAMMEVMYSEAADLPKKPYPSIEGFKNMQKVYTWREITRFKPEEFADASFVTELDKSGYIDSLYKKPSATAGAK